jgi:membrane-bound metal-dependent hydrolase YbcI (DUF457 family)
MENVAHTLLGLSLAKAGLERVTPLATTTLVISSNLPDLDVLSRLTGGTLAYLEHHRGFTHGFLGLVLLAAALAFALTLLDRRFRLRRDPFRRPIRPMRIFGLACLGGLSHTFLDYTNTYGVRPLLPFSARWFYGDLTFVVDPWIWLILGVAVVWLTANTTGRTVFWIVIGVLASLLVALFARTSSPEFPLTISTSMRVVWFAGLLLIIIGAVSGLGRLGAPVARYSLILLALYYGGMWMARQEARRQGVLSLPVESASATVAWPTPANPLTWQIVAADDRAIYTRYLNIIDSEGEWRELGALDPKFTNALRQNRDARIFLDFTRYGAAAVEERDDEFSVALRDMRFNLQMHATLDRQLQVQAVEVRWF